MGQNADATAAVLQGEGKVERESEAGLGGEAEGAPFIGEDGGAVCDGMVRGVGARSAGGIRGAGAAGCGSRWSGGVGCAGHRTGHGRHLQG